MRVILKEHYHRIGRYPQGHLNEPCACKQDILLKHLQQVPTKSLLVQSSFSLGGRWVPGLLTLPLSLRSRLLLQAGYNPNVQDRDGWTPLHAAAHWGVEEACRLLAEHFCDMEALNNVVSTREEAVGGMKKLLTTCPKSHRRDLV